MVTSLSKNQNSTISYRILIVDDDELIIESFERFFQEYENIFDIDKTSDSKEALRLIEQRNYDLVITDIVMPEVDGIQVLRKVKEVQPESEVILITAYSSTGSALDAMHFGAFDYITKPFDLSELKIRIMRAINKRKAVLQKQNKINEIERLLFSLSHDFKASIVAIKGFAKIFTQDYYNKIDSEGQFLINRINSNITTMESMVESLLEYTKIGNWQVETENINTKEIFQEVAANFTPALKGNNIHLILERNLPPVFFYKSGLRQIFSNLIDNAIKYARDDINSYIKVGINNSTIANSSFEHFYIEDNGVGISPHDANIIFDIFQRGVKCAQKKGYGIGLAVVKKILDTMNCTIRVESKESEQTRFYFTLPKARHC